MASYREQHEQFVSDNEGTSLFEIMAVVSIAPAVILVRNLMTAWLFSGEKKVYEGLKFVLDFLVLIVPVLLSFTIMADHLETILIILFFIAMGLMVCSERASPLGLPVFSSKILELPMQGKRPFITSFRAYVNIAGAISILAVDFQVFPRRFAKAETYGTGLMDVGVGAYVISNAIVSAEARGKYPPCRSLRNCIAPLLSSVKSTLPLLFLGFARLAAVKATDYHEHVSEYGVHWNFFFTLAIVKVLSTLLLCLVSSQKSWLIALIVGTVYQWCLNGAGISLYLQQGLDGKGGRQGILDANREGIFSAFGYLSIYFAGVQLGSYAFKNRSTVRDWCRCFIELLVMSAVAWGVLYAVDGNIEPVSRRFANLAYLIWMVAYSLSMFALFLLVDIAGQWGRATGLERTTKGQKPVNTFLPCMLEAINRNGLFYFLLLNLQTGLVNLSVRTMYTPDNIAMMILVYHMLSLSIITSYLQHWNITLRFW